MADYNVTGDLDASVVVGDYAEAGENDGKPVYKLAGQEWYIWWGSTSMQWNITAEVENFAGDRWKRIDENIEGEYSPGDPDVTGTPVVTLITAGHKYLIGRKA